MNYDAIGGRRFLFALLIFAVGSVMLAIGMIKSSEWVSLAEWIFTALAGLNVIQRGVEAARDVRAAAASDQPQ